MAERSAIVLGAGLQGATVALADAGYHITILDEADGCLQRASLRNEGKIHLGFVYAHDTSCRTATLVLESQSRRALAAHGGPPHSWRRYVTSIGPMRSHTPEGRLTLVILSTGLAIRGRRERASARAQERAW